MLVEPGVISAWRDALASLIWEPELVSGLSAGVVLPLSLDEHVDCLEEIYSDI
jgi:hypothetical protein